MYQVYLLVYTLDDKHHHTPSRSVFRVNIEQAVQGRIRQRFGRILAGLRSMLP